MMKVTLKNVQISFPELFVATTPKDYPTQNPAYSAVFVFDKGGEAHKAVEEAVKAVAKEAWLKKADAKLEEFRFNKMKFPMKDGDKTDKDYLQGKMSLTAKRQKSLGKPLVLDRDKSPISEEDDKIYTGAIVNAVVDVWAQTGANEGVRCQLVGVQYAAAGERIGVSAPDVADFDEIELSDEDDGLE